MAASADTPAEALVSGSAGDAGALRGKSRPRVAQDLDSIVDTSSASNSMDLGNANPGS